MTLKNCTDPLTGDAVDNPAVIYHAKCSDGTCAALAAWLRFAGQGDYLPMVHGEDIPDMTGRDVYMLDIAFSPEKLERLDTQARRLTVLDHHQSAADDLRHFKCRCGHLRFDMDKSAARLAWEFFHQGTPVPDLVSHVEDRDLLRWALDKSESYHATSRQTPGRCFSMASRASW